MTTKNMARTIPVLEDKESGLILSESNAILCYVADKWWHDRWYPADFTKRAHVNRWLHWMHHNSRMFTLKAVVPFMRPDLKVKFNPKSLKPLKGVCMQLEAQLSKSRYLASEDHPTIADLAVYGDVGQCQEQYLGVYDFSPYPNLVRWMKDLEQVPGYVESHEFLKNVIGPMIKENFQQAVADAAKTDAKL